MEEQRGKGTFSSDLVNVMYGVVASYGFYFIDRAVTISDYITFVFAYIVLFMDWLYSHHTYNNQEYRKSYLALDLVTLFIFSRLLSTSTTDRGMFFIWLAVIFALYFVWDFKMRQDNINTGYSWVTCLASDFSGAIIFLIFGLALRSQEFLKENVFISLIAVVIYAVITLAWFRKPASNRIQN